MMVCVELVVDILRGLRVGCWNLWCWIWYGSVILAPWISEVQTNAVREIFRQAGDEVETIRLDIERVGQSQILLR